MARTIAERVTAIETAVSNLVDAIKADRTAMIEAVTTLRKEISHKSNPVNMRAVGGAIAITATVMGLTIAALNFWYAAKAGPTEDTVHRIEQTLKHQSPDVLKYRVDEIERKLRLNTPGF